ncbi:MAG: hypothetical protein E8D45_00910 [Nitrospira sp.]|nr:MAG: hypothetical protein E8D45_00910 [Nitrospira sp.]
MNRNTVVGWFAIMLSLLQLVGLVRAAESDEATSRTASSDEQEVIVQIGGRMCEYHRSDVQRALTRFSEIQAVEFLNQHGTVLVRYQVGSAQPEAFADAVERALAMGWGCKAWVDRGG